MAFEIERKFLVINDSWRDRAKGEVYRQGYVSINKKNVTRVRVVNDKGYLTVKGGDQGLKRLEFEYIIPFEDASEMLQKLCEKPLIEKIRYEVEINGLVWEIDEFKGDNSGLVVAELELLSENQEFEKPGWAGVEVTKDPRYLNVNLTRNPYGAWKQ